MATTTPALLLVHGDGTIVGENQVARSVLGDGRGLLCWNFMLGLCKTQGLPCKKGCVQNLLASSHAAHRSQVRINSESYELTCIATSEERVACTIHPIDHPTKHEEARPYETLTPRERDVLERVAAGDTTAEIADTLGITTATVRGYVEQMRNKLGVSSRAALVARALRLGLIT